MPLHTQEVARSSSASSTGKRPAQRAFLFWCGKATSDERRAVVKFWPSEGPGTFSRSGADGTEPEAPDCLRYPSTCRRLRLSAENRRAMARQILIRDGTV